MTSSLDDVFATALEKGSPEERRAYLDEACRDDPTLRRQVERLLAAHAKAGSFLESPAPEIDATFSHPTAERAGDLIGRYKLLEEIGDGGMGVVYMAEQREPVRRKVALKIIKPGMDTREVIARFEAERQALAMMDHPNIAKVFDAGETESGRPYFVMELVHGIPLTEYCDKNELTIQDRLELFVQVCQAVHHAHQKGIIHRDIKPSNVMVALGEGVPMPKVIDFGIAKAIHGPLIEGTLFTRFGQMIGTPLYMSPEQAEMGGNIDIDTRSDIYSLGVMLYELLIGSTPFDEERIRKAAFDEVRRMIREDEPQRPSTRVSTLKAEDTEVFSRRKTDPIRLGGILRRDLDWIVMKALEKDRRRRYETASDFARDVRSYLAGEPVVAVPPSAGYRLQKFARRHKAGLTTSAIVAAILVIGTAVSAWQAVRAMRAEGRAVAGETLANERLKQVNAEKVKAQAVLGFVESKLLIQADPEAQADALTDAGASVAGVKPNPTVRELLDRASLELTPEKLNASLPDQPLAQAEILQTVGRAYTGLGDFQRAIGFLERSVTLYRQYLGPQGSETIGGISGLARAYQTAGKMDSAVPLFEETFSLLKSKKGPDDPETLTSASNLGTAYLDASKPNSAVPLLEDTVARAKVRLGPEYPVTLDAMNNLANAYLAVGKRDEALSLLEEALRREKTKFGAEHPHVIYPMNNLACALRDSGIPDLAVPIFKDAIALATSKLGRGHPTTLLITANLARAYQKGGRPDLALPMFVELVNQAKANRGPEHPDTLSCMNCLADTYMECGKFDLAVPLFEETLKLQKKTFGIAHRETLHTMGDLARAYFAAGRLEAAISLSRELVDLATQNLPLDDPDTLTMKNNLAVVYKAAGKLDLALPLFEETLRLRKAKRGPVDPDTLVSMKNLADAYQVIGKPELALPLVEEAYRAASKQPDSRRELGTQLLDGYYRAGKTNEASRLTADLLSDARHEFPKDSPQLADRLALIALPLLQGKDFPAAESVLRECLSIRQKALPDDWRTFNTNSALGGALFGQKKYSVAEPLLLAGYQGMKEREAKIPPEGKVRVTEAIERLVQLYEALGKKDEAAKWRKELAARKKAA